MGLKTTPLGQELPPEPERPKIYSNTYKHTIVDSAYTPETSLLTMVDGTPRLMEYYRRELGPDEELSTFQPDNSAVYQSYARIKNLVGKQDGAGAYAFDPTTGQSSGTFEMWLAFDLNPLQYDVAIMDIGEGRAGLFHITQQPEIRNDTSNKVYLCTFEKLGILTEDLFAQLDIRVVKEWVYSKDSALHGGIAIITDNEFTTAKELFDWRLTIANWLMNTFYWNPERTIAWEDGNGRKIYDQYLVKFLAAQMPADLRTSYPPINLFSTQYGGREYGGFGDITIWEILMRGDFNLLPMVKNSEITIVSTNRLINTRQYGNLRSSKFDWVVVADPERYQIQRAYFNMDGFPLLASSPEYKTTYLFTPQFYEGLPQNEFEHLVVDALKNQMVDREKLLAYCKGYFALDKWQQLYHGAILLLLIQVSRKFGPPI
jgi:hypothetical protein